MIILLSPAKTLDFQSEPPSKSSTELLFPEQAEVLAKKMSKYSVASLRKLMDISEALAQENVERFQNWALPVDKDRARQAVFAFQGDVYQGLQADTFTENDLERAQERLRILSGLYGVLRPLDLMLPYRLEMGTSLKVSAKKPNLYAYWKEQVTAHIAGSLEQSGTDVVLNLASQEYAKVVDFKKLGCRVIAPQFKEERQGRFQMISFFAKKARGLMAAFVLRNDLREAEQLKEFDSEGYGFNEALSDMDDNKWVFTRKTK